MRPPAAAVLWACAACALLQLRPVVHAAQTFRGGTDAVEVDVLVTRGGRPVASLTVDDFELRDSGVIQRIDAIAVEHVPVTAMLVLDVSESVDGQPLEHLRSAVDAAAGALSASDRLALLTFSHHVTMAAQPTTDLERVRSAVRAVKAGGATALYDGAFAALAMRERVKGRAVMLVFSDGDDTASWLDPRDVIAAAQRSDVVVYGVTLAQRAERENLNAVMQNRREQEWFLQEPALYGRQFLGVLATESGGAVLVAERSDSLRDTFVRVISEFKSRYVLTYTPTGVAPGGWHALDVRLKRVRADVTARRGYLRGAK